MLPLKFKLEWLIKENCLKITQPSLLLKSQKSHAWSSSSINVKPFCSVKASQKCRIIESLDEEFSESAKRVLCERVQRKGVFASELSKSLGEHFLGCSIQLCTICRDIREYVLRKLFSSRCTKVLSVFRYWGRSGFVTQIYTLLIVSKIIIFSCLCGHRLYCQTMLNFYLYYFSMKIWCLLTPVCTQVVSNKKK